MMKQLDNMQSHPMKDTIQRIARKVQVWLRYVTCTKLLSWQEFILSVLAGVVLTSAISFACTGDVSPGYVIGLILVLIVILFLFISLVFFYNILLQHDAFVEEHETCDLLFFKRSKIITIHSADILDKTCDVVDSYLLKNMTGQDYDEYSLKFFSSSGDFFDTNTYLLTIDGASYSGTSSRITCKKSYFADESTGNRIANILETKLRLQIPPGKVCDFSLLRKSRTMPKLFNFDAHRTDDICRESVSATITHKTNKLKLACYIDDTLREAGYYVAPQCNGEGEFLFDICDGAKQPMKNYRTALSDMHIVPRKTYAGVVWKIPNPKIGYTYTLYFCLCNNHPG